MPFWSPFCPADSRCEHFFGIQNRPWRPSRFLDAFGLPFGALLAPFGSLLAPFWHPLAPFGSLLVPFGSILGHFWDTFDTIWLLFCRFDEFCFPFAPF